VVHAVYVPEPSSNANPLLVELSTGVYNAYVDILMKASSNLHVTTTDVQLNVSHVIIHLKTSKSDIEKKSVDVRLFPNGITACALLALNTFARIRTNSRMDSLFFVLPNGQRLSRRAFIANLRHLLTRLGILASSSSGHNLRVEATAAGVPDYLIQFLERWTSLSYFRYILIDKYVIQQTDNKILKFSI
jgi:hypothetical protein